VLGSTPIGQARGRALAKAIPFAQRAGFATKVGTANNAKALGGHKPTAFAVRGLLPDPRARPRRRHEPPVRQLLTAKSYHANCSLAAGSATLRCSSSNQEPAARANARISAVQARSTLVKPITGLGTVPSVTTAAGG